MTSLLRRIEVEIRVALVRLGYGAGRLLGARRRRVLLATAHAEGLGGNLAFVRADLARRHPDVPVEVLAHRARGGWRGRLAGAVAAIRAGAAIARARVVVLDDYFFPAYVVRPPEGLVVQTWHASGAFKRIGRSVRDASFGADRAVTDRVAIHGTYDVCLVGSPEAVPHYAEAFGLPAERFRWDVGIPRTDLFFDPERRAAAERTVRARYRLDGTRRAVLWAPTFRGDRVTAARDPGRLDLRVLEAALGADHVVLLRLHPFVRRRLDLTGLDPAFVRDVSDHPDINELMLVSDLLVTDYSSAIFEFSLLERPIAFYAPDLAAYERERGFYHDYRAWVPGPIFESGEALAAWIRAGPVDVAGVRRFREASFAVADGRATERLVDGVVLPAMAAEGRQRVG